MDDARWWLSGVSATIPVCTNSSTTYLVL
jgi:hypothetical protein